jgi:hypothetical protein
MRKISKLFIMFLIFFLFVALANPNTVNAAEEGLTFEEYNRYDID